MPEPLSREVRALLDTAREFVQQANDWGLDDRSGIVGFAFSELEAALNPFEPPQPPPARYEDIKWE